MRPTRPSALDAYFVVADAEVRAWRVGSLKSCTGRYLMQGIGSGAARCTQAYRAELMNYEADLDADVRKGATG